MTTLESRITRLKASATSRGLIVRLMNYEYDNLLKGGCHYCGASLLNEAGYCLDRVNSNKGYVLNNVVGCCKHCNFAKRLMGLGEFIEWVNRVHQHTNKIINQLQNIDTDVSYSYKKEKELHKINRTTKEKYCIKVNC